MMPLTVPLADQMTIDVFLMLNTGRPQSALSPRTFRLLTTLGHVTQRTGPRVVIRGARIGDMRLTDFPMRLSAGPSLLGLEGIIGLDFLEQYAEARLDFRARRMTLVPA